MKKYINKILNSSIFWILIICLIVFSPIISKVSFGHDIEFHLTNMDMLLEKITNGNIFNISNKIFGTNVVRGLGYGTFLFYPCLSYYFLAFVAFILKLLGLNHLMSISYTLILISFLSGCSMYMFAKKIYNDKKVALLCSIGYITSTYFLCDIFVRTAVAECLIFIFIPIIFSSLYELFWGNKYYFYLLFIVGYVGIINSHLVMSVYLTLFIIIIFLLNFKKVFKMQIIKRLFIASIIVLFICSPFIINLLEHKFLGNYVVFDNVSMFSVEQLNNNTNSLYDYLFIGDKTSNGIMIYFNYVTLISFILVIIFNKKIFVTKKDKKIFVNCLLLFFISMFFASDFFSWKYMPMFLKNIQFPWRLCTFMSFSMTLVAGNILKCFNIDIKKYLFYIIIIIMVLFSVNTVGKKKNYLYDLYFYNYNIGHQWEYLPVNAINNIDYYSNRGGEVRIINGKGKIGILNNDTPYMLVNVSLEDEFVELELPRLYYLGYNIELIDGNGKVEKIDYYENDNGFIGIKLTDSGTLRVTYKGTKLVNIFNCVRYLIVVIFVLLLYFDYKKKKNYI